MPKPSLAAAPLFLALAFFGCTSDRNDGSASPAPTLDGGTASAPLLPTNGIIACFYDEARAAGVTVLEEGGTAADAFVAITLVDYVRAAGETSLGGPLGALTYEAKTGKVESLDATFDSVGDPAGLYDPASPKVGASVLVPGALRGLEALWKAKGKLPWARLVTPAKALAENGYAADALLNAEITYRRALLERSAYAKALYLPLGSPLAVGATVKQPELAAFLEEVAARGSSAMYDAGSWADSFVTQINAQGGKAALSDLARYQAKWDEPWSLRIRGNDVFANAGRAYGGVYGLVGLSVLAHDPRDPTTLDDADRLEVRLRTARALYDDPWFYEATKLDDPAFVRDHLENTNALWSRIAAQIPAVPRAAKGSHSLQVTVVDRNGDAVTGTNTINAEPWGSGIFVRGVALTEAGMTTMLVPGPAQRVVTPLTVHVVTSEGHLRYIGGAFGASLLETELQLVADAALGESLTADALVKRPRFGTFPFDFSNLAGGSDLASNWLDVASSPALVAELERRGLHVKLDPQGDTGWGAFILRGPTGALAARTLDEKWFRGGAVELAR